LRDSPELRLDAVDASIHTCGTLQTKKAAINKRKKIPPIGHIMMGIFFINHTKI